MARFEPVKVLNRILNRLCQIDRFGVFALPVTEAEAPGYSSVIDKPMCFSTMREKIDAGEYRTWGAFLGDFQLMLRNALYFNDRKSSVYRIAMQLNKEGNERLKEVDIEGRQAIYLMHPGGPAAAAEEEAREFEERNLPPPMNPFLMIPSQNPVGADGPLDGDENDEEESIGYSSFSDTDSEDGRGRGCPSVMKMQTALNDAIEGDVSYETWKEGPLCGLTDPNDAIFEWHDDKSDLERRCLWLEFRMKELQDYLEHYSLETDEEEEEMPTVRYRYERTKIDDIPERTNDDRMETSDDGRADDSCEEESYPGRVYLNLGVLAEETTKLIALLTSRQRISQSRMLSAKPQKKSTTPRKKSQSSCEILEPKRSRRDFEHPLHHSDSYGTTGSMDRPTKLNIAVPNIQEIPRDKAEKWEKAKRMLRQKILEDPEATMPEEVMQALQLSADEGTSEEDISDAIYLERHQEMESAERERHLCLISPVDPKRKKLPEKRPKRSTSGMHSHRTPVKRGRGRKAAGRPVSGQQDLSLPASWSLPMSAPWLPLSLPVYSSPIVSLSQSNDVTSTATTSI